MPTGAAMCPNCGRDRFIVEPMLFLDPETDEIIGRELQCIDCSYTWEQWPGEPVQTGVESWS